MDQFRNEEERKVLMDAFRVKTLRHIETVRNYINKVIAELIKRSEKHDQSKLEDPEDETFAKYTEYLRQVKYGSDEYNKFLEEMKPALDHHYAHNAHHPEHFKHGIKDMTLFDIIEMLCDWKASTLRSNDGNILKSIDMNQTKFGYSDELKHILLNTILVMEQWSVLHKANES